MRIQLKGLIAGVALAAALPAFAQYKVLATPLTTQEHSQWCWSATSKSILNFYKKTPSQCQIVNWAYGINYACGNTTFYWNSNANTPNNMYGTSGSVQNILNAWGVSNGAYNVASSWSSVVWDINANRPFVMRYGWTNGGGHIMVGRGYQTYNGVNYVYIMDPWPGEGLTVRTYNSAVYASDHRWTHTQRMNINGPI